MEEQPFYDAVGYQIKEIDDFLGKDGNSDTFKKISIFIITDGEENSSKNYKSSSSIQSLIESKKVKGGFSRLWELK